MSVNPTVNGSLSWSLDGHWRTEWVFRRRAWRPPGSGGHRHYRVTVVPQGGPGARAYWSLVLVLEYDGDVELAAGNTDGPEANEHAMAAVMSVLDVQLRDDRINEHRHGRHPDDVDAEAVFQSRFVEGRDGHERLGKPVMPDDE